MIHLNNPKRFLPTPGALMRTAIVLCGFALFGQNAMAQEEADLAEEELACLKCHDKPGMSKKLDDGKSLSMHIATKDFARSMHNDTSCEDCHEDIEENHGKVKKPIASSRAYSLTYQESCRTCHKKDNAKFDDSLHAALLKAGDEKAPLCTTCHDPHYLLSKKVRQPIAKVACLDCHDKVGEAYTHDVHGVAYAKNDKDAPVCKDCHSSHGVQAASLGTSIRDNCLDCHKKADEEHREWLPNVGRHFDAVACAACHSPQAKRRVNLRVFNASTNTQLSEQSGLPLFVDAAKSADTTGRGLDAAALRAVLKTIGTEMPDTQPILRGRLELQTGVDAHRIAKKDDAIKDCALCHSAGAAAFQQVSITVARPDGLPLRHDVQPAVLNSLFATDSIRGFYTLGSSRIKLLDYALILLVVGTAGGVFGHWAIRRALRGYRQRRQQQSGKSH